MDDLGQPNRSKKRIQLYYFEGKYQNFLQDRLPITTHSKKERLLPAIDLIPPVAL